LAESVTLPNGVLIKILPAGLFTVLIPTIRDLGKIDLKPLNYATTNPTATPSTTLQYWINQLFPFNGP
jgi:hypothetical protein